jgi:hypothetical protein
MDITHSSWKITKLHYAKVYDERDHRREGADGLDAVPESRLKECLQKGWVTDRMSPTDESERLFGVERGGGESEFCVAENIFVQNVHFQNETRRILYLSNTVTGLSERTFTKFCSIRFETFPSITKSYFFHFESAFGKGILRNVPNFAFF